jgi:RNA polymerase sigma-70 factor (ECF subfamily)
LAGSSSDAIARFLPPARAKCRRLLGTSAAADDVAQEAVVRLWKSGVVEGGDVRAAMAWLFRTCTHLAIDVLRDRRRTDAGEVDLDASPCGVNVAGTVEARAVIVALAASVPQDELSAAILCRVDALSHPEAALVLGVNERTVRRWLERFDERVAPLRKEMMTS